jgi:hypothetical protein
MIEANNKDRIADPPFQAHLAAFDNSGNGASNRHDILYVPK